MSNRNKVIISIVIVVLLILGAFIGGRHSVPTRTVIQEKVRIEQVERQVVVTKVETKVETVYVKAEARDVHTETIVTKAPDGTTITKVVTDDKTKTQVNNNTNTNISNNSMATDDKHSLMEKEKTITTERIKPQWSVAIQPGYDVAGALGKSTYNILPDSLPIKHIVLGASVEHRFIGPVSLGVWGNTQGSGGLSVRVEF